LNQRTDVSADEADVEERDQHHDQEGEDGERRAQADDPVGGQNLLRFERERVRVVRAFGQHIRQVEHAKRVERPEDECNEDRRRE
jgi:hypothetical protein